MENISNQPEAEGGKSPIEPRDDNDSGATSTLAGEGPSLATDTPAVLSAIQGPGSRESEPVGSQRETNMNDDQDTIPVQIATPALDDAELDWSPAPMTPESMADEHFVNTDPPVENGALNDGNYLGPEIPPSPQEPEAAVAIEPEASQSPDTSLQYDQDTPDTIIYSDGHEPAPDQREQPEESPKVYGFVPDEPLEVDERLLRYVASHANVSMSQAVDSQSWIPEDFSRQPTGSTVAEPESVLGRSGRTYHGFKEGKYFMPNDGQEQDRLDFQHRALTILIDERLHAAPVQNPKYVMDIATGTGIWAMDFAQQYPDSKVIGVDLSKIQPKNAPPNVEFIKDDSEEPWVFAHKFDYVHARAVFTCFNDQKAVMRNAFENLNEGGWIEYLDGSFVIGCLDGTIEGTALKRWGELLVQGGLALGRNLEVTKHFKEWLEEAGFVDVVERKLPWAYSPWPQDRRLKLAGKFMQSNIYEGIRGISFVFLTGAGLSEIEINELILQVRADLMNPRIHAFMPVWSVYGRKPFNHEVNAGQV